jgi:transcription elongation factor Elf1
MAGPIGIGVVSAIRAVTCPHCGAKQARAKSLKGLIKCKVCKKAFEIEAVKKRSR